MKNIDLTIFLQKGVFLNFDEKTNEISLNESFGSPDEIEDYGDNGKYLHYGNIRFLFQKRVLKGITISFYNITEDLFIIYIKDEKKSINADTSLLTMINILNQLSIKWEVSYEGSTLDYLLLKTETAIEINYHFYDSKLTKMSRFFY